ncbi:acetyl-CoA carboxylase biotin carboxyl carrier protein subunit [Gemmobacter lanyuensis]
MTLWQVDEGTVVEPGQVIAVVEAMKMETRIEAHRAGRLTITAQAGATVMSGSLLARILP